MVGAVACGAYWYFPPQVIAAQDAAAKASTERDQALTSLAQAKDQIAVLDKKLEETEATLEKLHSQLTAPPPVVILHPQDPVPPVDQKQLLRDAAKGELVPELVTTYQTYQNIKITEVTPDGISFTFADGAAKIKFEDLSEAWRNRFQFDPAEAAAYRNADAARSTEVSQEVAQELAEQAENAAKAQVPPTNPQSKSPALNAIDTSELARCQAAIAQLNKEIQMIKSDPEHCGLISWLTGHMQEAANIAIHNRQQSIGELQERIKDMQNP